MAQIDLEEVLLALRAILLSVSGLPAPADRVWDDAYVVVGGQREPYEPKTGVPYLTEQFAPATSSLITTVTCGQMTDTGLYLPTWFGIKGEGGKAIRAGTTAIKAAFYPGRTVALASGNRLRIRTDPAPRAGQVIPLEQGGHSYQQVTIPWEVGWNLSP
jgi:hypothetical protein